MTTPAGGIEPDPCPFCGETLIRNDNQEDFYVKRYGTHWKHPLDDCYLSDMEISPIEVAAWQRRASTATASLEPQSPLVHLTERSALQPEAPCEDLADARRYRWLRAQKYIDIGMAWFVPMHQEKELTPEAMDAAIDAAMKERP